MGFEELWVLSDVFSRVCRRTEEGDRFTRDLIKYIEKRIKAEHLNTDVFKQDQEIGTMQDMWVSLKDETEAQAAGHEAFATKMQELLDNIKSNHMEERKNRALLVAKGNKLQKDLNVVEQAMRKAKGNYFDLRRAQEKSAGSLDKAKQTGDTKKEGSAQKQYEKDENKADRADNEYRITVNNLKVAQDQYYDTDLPALLREFEAYEKARSDSTRKFFDQLTSLQEAVGPHTSAAADRLRKKVNSVDAKADLELFVSTQNAKECPAPERAQYEAFDSNSVTSEAPLSARTPNSSHSASSSSAPPDDGAKKKKGFGFGKLGSLTKGHGGKSKKEKKETVESPTPSSPSSSTTFETSGPRMKTKDDSNANGDHDHSGSAQVPAKHESPMSTPVVPKRDTEDFTKVEVSIEAKRNDEPTPAASVAPIVETTVVTPAPVSVATVSDAGAVELIALYDYTASEDNEISFGEGEKVILLEKDESGWWKGRNLRGEVGVFPSNFVEVVGEGGSDALANAGAKVEINADYRALYDYEAEDETELTIKEGEVLRVLSETDGWYFGTNAQGREGNFPSNFVEPV